MKTLTVDNTKQVKDRVWIQSSVQVSHRIRIQVRNQIRNQVRRNRNQTWTSVFLQIGDQIYENINR
jgi:hypothetical protein